MLFSITVKDNYGTHNYVVTHEIVNIRLEKFAVQRGDEKYILTSNRPYLRHHPGLKKRKPEYTLIHGSINNMTKLAQIFEEITMHMDGLG